MRVYAQDYAQPHDEPPYDDKPSKANGHGSWPDTIPLPDGLSPVEQFRDIARHYRALGHGYFRPDAMSA